MRDHGQLAKRSEGVISPPFVEASRRGLSAGPVYPISKVALTASTFYNNLDGLVGGISTVYNITALNLHRPDALHSPMSAVSLRRNIRSRVYRVC